VTPVLLPREVADLLRVPESTVRAMARDGRGPVRIQRKRTKGWRMPPSTVYVGRPTRWGNPFPVGKYGPVAAVEYFRAFLVGEFVPAAEADYRQGERVFYGPAPALLYPGEVAAIFLRGKNLACWCALNEPCHADVLLEVANA
jgi:hypothetical protein